MAFAVPLSRFTPRVGGGSAFFVRPPIMHLSFDTLIVLLVLSAVSGASVGWFCRRVVVLIALTLVLSYVITFAICYVPDFIRSVGWHDPRGGASPLEENRAWAPLILRYLFFCGSPAIWISAGIAHFTRSRYDRHHKPVA